MKKNIFFTATVLACLGFTAVPLFASKAAATKKTQVPSAISPSSATKQELLNDVEARWTTKVSTGTLALVGSAEQTANFRRRLSEFKLQTVDIVRVPLSQALESLAVEAPKDLSLNFVVGAGNDPEVTLNLKNTTLAEALDLLVESAGMTYELRGNTVVILPMGSVGVLKTRYFPLSQSLITRLIGAELAKAPAAEHTSSAKSAEMPALYQHGAAESAIKGFFERLGIAWPEGSGMVLADGELIVTHNTRTLDRIEEIVLRLARHRQVEIEARFMEVGEGALNELGVQWSVANHNGNGPNKGGTLATATGDTNSLRSLSSAFGTTAASSASGASAPQIPSGVNLGSGATATADVSGIIDSVKIRGIITALSQADGTELLSAPRVTVLSGSTANITVAQEMRYPQSYDRVNTDVGSSTSSGSVITAPTPLDFTTRNVGVQMQVTPYVEDDNSITLVLQPEVTQFERFIDYGGQSIVLSGSTSQTIPSGFFQPVFSVRRLTTEVNLPSGATVLMGGLTREETIKVKDKVPVLGDIPLIGRIFRNHGTSTLKKNLVVFVTARLVE